MDTESTENTENTPTLIGRYYLGPDGIGKVEHSPEPGHYLVSVSHGEVGLDDYGRLVTIDTMVEEGWRFYATLPDARSAQREAK